MLLTEFEQSVSDQLKGLRVLECLLDCKTVVFFSSKSEKKKLGKAWRKTYVREPHMPVGRVRLSVRQEQSNKRSGTRPKTESETGERR